jgi:hypothetical protein
MDKDSEVIATDNPLNESQKAKLVALQDSIIPSNEERKLPSAGDMDLISQVINFSPEFVPLLMGAVDYFDDEFAGLDNAERHPLVQAFSEQHPELFGAVIFHTYACYYQDDRVRAGLDLAPGPPFPRGNEVKQGDLSLLDEVLKRPPMYRR